MLRNANMIFSEKLCEINCLDVCNWLRDCSKICSVLWNQNDLFNRMIKCALKEHDKLNVNHNFKIIGNNGHTFWKFKYNKITSIF